VNETGNRYWEDGYLALKSFVPADVTRLFLAKLKSDLIQGGVSFGALKRGSDLLKREAVELYGMHYAPMAAFLWGMTPAISSQIRRNLLPTYSYFRVYRKGDILRVHSDRLSCEHSVSLLLATSDENPWSLEIGEKHIETPRQRADDDFGDEKYASVAMSPGDAVLYQGVHRLHGRITPNPNRWSAHLFLHWVDVDGPYAKHAFDGQQIPDVAQLELG
jgi:hypothetical protein